MKHCPDCDTMQSGQSFHMDRSKKDGLAPWCKKCTAKRVKVRRAANGGKSKAQLAADARWRERNRERIRSESQEYRDRTRDERQARKFGITVEELMRLQIECGGLCRICRRPCGTGRSLSVDHDHKTGRVRGLLCFECNSGLGKFQDDPGMLQRAIDYLSGALV